jgi:flagellar hook assembly protein FlgD
VHNLRGQEVATLINGPRSAGYFKVAWNGRGPNNRRLTDGVYFVKLSTPDGSKILKLPLAQ